MTSNKQKLYNWERVEHWDQIARDSRRWSAGNAYHRRMAEFFSFIIPAGSRILEVGCGSGDLLAALNPSRGVGIDLSPEMIANARKITRR